jgi:hypothetical protein
MPSRRRFSLLEDEHGVYLCRETEKLMYDALCQSMCEYRDTCTEEKKLIPRLAYGAEFNFDQLEEERGTAYILCPGTSQYFHYNVCRMRCPEVKKCHNFSEYLMGGERYERKGTGTNKLKAKG